MGSYKWVISPLVWVISIVTLLITLLMATHEPPSNGRSSPGFWLLVPQEGPEVR